MFTLEKKAEASIQAIEERTNLANAMIHMNKMWGYLRLKPAVYAKEKP
jgi:hypothetical protein